MGGIGNQMFQYAAGRALAIRHNTVLKLDLSFLNSDQNGNTHRNYMLDKLKIVAEIINNNELDGFRFYNSRSNLNITGKLLNKFLKKSSFEVLHEFDNTINDTYFTATDNSFLIGYWQSSDYFFDCCKLINYELLPPASIDPVNIKLANLITSCNSIAVHVRRGDYVSDPVIHAAHGVCSAEYYHYGARTVATLVSDPHFYIFSDDPGWVREHLHLPFPVTIVDHNTSENPHEDLLLMSLCRHNIIANSSFSWWGAWLNSNPGKIVVAPKRWFATDDHAPQRLIPGDWLRL